MASPIQSIRLDIITADTLYQELNSISVLNQSTDPLEIQDITNSGKIVLEQGQSVTITSSTGFVLPKLLLTSIGVILADVITT
jgi:hypothetical protein